MKSVIIPLSCPVAALSTLITVFRITEISLEFSSNALAFMLSLDTVAAAAERIEWEGAVRRGVRALSDITGAGEEREDGGGGRGEKGEGRENYVSMKYRREAEEGRKKGREGEEEREKGIEYGRDSDINRNEKEEEKKER